MSTQNKYTFAGFLFGLIFPVISTLITVMMEGLTFSPGVIFNLHLNTPLLLIIDTAPLILGIAGIWLGNRQKKLIELHNRLEADFERYFALSPDLLCLISANSRLQKINPAFPNTIGLPPQSILGHSVWEFIHPEDQEASKQAVMEVFTSQKPLEVENRLKTLSGGWVRIAWSITPTESKQIFAIGRDVTQRHHSETQLKAYAEDLEATNNELDQFAYVTSHDLKAPLRAISTLATFIEEDMESGETEEVKKHLVVMRKRVSRMEGLIQGILEFARIGRQHIEREELDLRESVMDVLEGIEKPPGIHIEVIGDFPTVMANSFRVGQVIQNLVTNAINHHDKSEGLIQISVEDKPTYWEFCFKDDGPGIHPDYQEKIFEVFQTLHSRDEKESTGIGLSIVKKIVEEAGGKIWVVSEEGKGSEFRFTLLKNRPIPD